jgi:hypothetical protein
VDIAADLSRIWNYSGRSFNFDDIALLSEDLLGAVAQVLDLAFVEQLALAELLDVFI